MMSWTGLHKLADIIFGITEKLLYITLSNLVYITLSNTSLTKNSLSELVL